VVPDRMDSGLSADNGIRTF